MSGRLWLSESVTGALQFNGAAPDQFAVPQHYAVAVKDMNGFERPYYVAGEPPPRAPGYYEFGTTNRINPETMRNAYALCCACIRANRSEAHVPVLEMQKHIFEEHTLSPGDWLQFEGHFGYTALIEYVE